MTYVSHAGPIYQSPADTRATSRRFRCEEVSSLEAGGVLWHEWSALLERVAPEHRLFGPGWYRIWSDTWGDRGEWVDFRLITVRDREGILRGIMPIGLRRCGPVKVHTMTGYPQPARAVIAERDWERQVGYALADYIADRGWRLTQIGPVRHSHLATRSLIEALHGKMALYVLRSQDLAVLHAPETWDEYRRHVLGAKFFRKLGYYERRTARASDMRIVHYRHPSPEDVPRIFDDLAAIEGRSWLARSGDPRFLAPSARSLWSRLSTEFLVPRSLFDCWIMYLDDRPVSFCLALTTGSCRYVIANNFDEACKDHRTGSTLYRHMMEEGFERGVRTVDFGHGDLHYKRHWGAVAEGGWATYLAFPADPAGRMSRVAFALGHVICGTGDFTTLLDRLL